MVELQAPWSWRSFCAGCLLTAVMLSSFARLPLDIRKPLEIKPSFFAAQETKNKTEAPEGYNLPCLRDAQHPLIDPLPYTCPKMEVEHKVGEPLPDSLVLSWYGGEMKNNEVTQQVLEQRNDSSLQGGAPTSWTRGSSVATPVLHPAWMLSPALNAIMTSYSSSDTWKWVNEQKNSPEFRSQMHVDVMMLAYHVAKIMGGDILELGIFEGGLSVCLAKGLADASFPLSSGRALHLDSWDVAIERTTARMKAFGLQTGGIWKANFRDNAMVDRVSAWLGGNKISILVLDNDGNCHCDLKYFLQFTIRGSILIIDDYVSSWADNWKVLKTQDGVKRFSQAGYIQALGVYGWGTWIGIVLRAPRGVIRDFDA